ncbi:MAG: hypothetical protein MHM6MM_001058 [Cercozoa sp. M6MM]
MQQPAHVLERTVWTYWEGEMPIYMPLLLRTCSFHHGRQFQIIDPGTAFREITRYWAGMYLDENSAASIKQAEEYAASLWTQLLRVLPAQRSDIIRQTWLHIFGGIWLDADTFCLRDLSPVMLDQIGAGH